MGNWLIFQYSWKVTDAVSCHSLSDWDGSEGVPGNNLHNRTVPETDTGGLVEYTKALERTTLKELGKMPP